MDDEQKPEVVVALRFCLLVFISQDAQLAQVSGWQHEPNRKQRESQTLALL